MTTLAPDPKEWLPPDLVAAMGEFIEHRDDLYKIACRVAQRFRVRNIPEDDCVAWLVDSGMDLNYGDRLTQYEYQITRAVSWTYASFDPAKASSGGPPGPGFVEGLERLRAAVEASNMKDKKYMLGLVQHALNTGFNPVNCSSRQLAALVGIKSNDKANEAMNRLEATLGGGFLRSVTYDGVIGHSRLWHLNTDGEGDIYIMHEIYVPPSAHSAQAEQRFVEWVSAAPVGADFTITSVSKYLNVSRGKARALLDRYQDVYFGGSFFPGGRTRKRVLPAKWWRAETRVLFPALPKEKPPKREKIVRPVPAPVEEYIPPTPVEVEVGSGVDPRTIPDPFDGIPPDGEEVA